MGLFIGASILTVLELFDYAYEVSGGGASARGHGRGGVQARPPAHLPSSLPGDKTQAVQTREVPEGGKTEQRGQGRGPQPG